METVLIDASKANSSKEKPHCSMELMSLDQSRKRIERDEDTDVLVIEDPLQKKATPSKRSKGKKVLKTEEDDDDDRVPRWKDDEIEMFIALRGEMDDEFKKNGKKQGVDTWHKLHARLLSQVPGLKKSHVATKKKFNSLSNIYKEDKLTNNVYGESRHESKFYDQFESWFSQTGSVHKHVSASANGPDLHVDETELDDPQDNTQNPTSTIKASKKTKFNDEAMVLFGKMVETGEGLLKSFNRTTEVLNNQLDRLIDKL